MNPQQPPQAGAWQQTPPPGMPQQQQAASWPQVQQAQPQWFVNAQRKASFFTLVKAEFRKLFGTLSDKILIVAAPLALIALNLFPLLTAAPDYTASGQIQITTVDLQFGALVMHAILIKLIAGEWQYRSAQPTLLVQPSRVRYMLAQATIAVFVWVICAVSQIIMTMLIAPIPVEAGYAQYLLGLRPGWVIGVCLLGSFIMVLFAFTTALLMPNAAGSLSIYLVLAIVFIILQPMIPGIVSWFDPSQPMLALADNTKNPGIGPVITSSLVLVGLTAFAVARNWRRDAA